MSTSRAFPTWGQWRRAGSGIFEWLGSISYNQCTFAAWWSL